MQYRITRSILHPLNQTPHSLDGPIAHLLFGGLDIHPCNPVLPSWIFQRLQLTLEHLRSHKVSLPVAYPVLERFGGAMAV